MLRSQISSETDRSPHILEGQKVKKGCFLKEWQETQWKTMKNYCFWRVSWLNDAKCIVSSFRELILWFGPSPSSRITRIVLCGRNFPPTNVVGLNTLSHWSRIHLGASQKLDEVGYTIVLMDPRWLFFCRKLGRFEQWWSQEGGLTNWLSSFASSSQHIEERYWSKHPMEPDEPDILE